MSIAYVSCKRGASVVLVGGLKNDEGFNFTPGNLYRICEITPREMCLKDDDGRLRIFSLDDGRFRDAAPEDLHRTLRIAGAQRLD